MKMVRGKLKETLREFEVLLERISEFSSNRASVESRELGEARRTQGSLLQGTPSQTVFFEARETLSWTVFSNGQLEKHAEVNA